METNRRSPQGQKTAKIGCSKCIQKLPEGLQKASRSLQGGLEGVGGVWRGVGGGLEGVWTRAWFSTVQAACNYRSEHDETDIHELLRSLPPMPAPQPDSLFNFRIDFIQFGAYSLDSFPFKLRNLFVVFRSNLETRLPGALAIRRRSSQISLRFLFVVSESLNEVFTTLALPLSWGMHIRSSASAMRASRGASITPLAGCSFG